jgi:hypothetical protein
MFQAIIIGVIILALLLVAAVSVSRAMRKNEPKGPPVDGSGAEAPGDGADGPGGDGD